MFDGPLTSELDPGERRARLRLARSARIGPVTFHEALAHFGSARAACARLDTTGEAAIAREEDTLPGRRPLPGVRRSRLSARTGRPAGSPRPVGHRRLGLLGRPTLAVVGAREASWRPAVCGELARALGAAGFVTPPAWRAASMRPPSRPCPGTSPCWLAASTGLPPQNAGLQGAIASEGLLLSDPPGVRRRWPRLSPSNRIVSGCPGRRGHRGGSPFGLADHRPPGGRARARRFRRPGFAGRPALCRIQ